MFQIVILNRFSVEVLKSTIESVENFVDHNDVFNKRVQAEEGWNSLRYDVHE